MIDSRQYGIDRLGTANCERADRLASRWVVKTLDWNVNNNHLSVNPRDEKLIRAFQSINMIQMIEGLNRSHFWLLLTSCWGGPPAPSDLLKIPSKMA
jgi:hypothetical protein